MFPPFLTVTALIRQRAQPSSRPIVRSSGIICRRKFCVAFMWTQLRFGQKSSTNPFVLSTGHAAAFFNDRGHRSHRGPNYCQLFARCSLFARPFVCVVLENACYGVCGERGVDLSMLYSYAFPEWAETETFTVVREKIRYVFGFGL